MCCTAVGRVGQGEWGTSALSTFGGSMQAIDTLLMTGRYARNILDSLLLGPDQLRVIELDAERDRRTKPVPTAYRFMFDECISFRALEASKPETGPVFSAINVPSAHIESSGHRRISEADNSYPFMAPSGLTDKAESVGHVLHPTCTASSTGGGKEDQEIIRAMCSRVVDYVSYQHAAQELSGSLIDDLEQQQLDMFHEAFRCQCQVPVHTCRTRALPCGKKKAQSTPHMAHAARAIATRRVTLIAAKSCPANSKLASERISAAASTDQTASKTLLPQRTSSQATQPALGSGYRAPKYALSRNASFPAARTNRFLGHDSMRRSSSELAPLAAGGKKGQPRRRQVSSCDGRWGTSAPLTVYMHQQHSSWQLRPQRCAATEWGSSRAVVAGGRLVRAELVGTHRAAKVVFSPELQEKLSALLRMQLDTVRFEAKNPERKKGVSTALKA